ncbi:MAG: thiolase domain-containing protein [Gemmatimonadetes bacterium]|nr:thiolase domain-containing protein [Gemmatimonadota bacterium]
MWPEAYSSGVRTSMTGGAAFEFHVQHAAAALRDGLCELVLVSYGSDFLSRMGRSLGTAGFGGSRRVSGGTMWEAPYGLPLVGSYAMVAQRHMFEFGTTSEQLAEISVGVREYASLNPLAMYRDPLTVDAVVSSRMIADPLHKLDCCVVSDGGGAYVIASPEVVADTKKPPVWIIGTGEATKYRTNGGDITTSAGAQSAPIAFAEAEVTPDEIDIAMIYDSFSITVLTMLEDLGFCAKGEGGAWVEGGRLRFDRPNDGPALNTDGGGLSSNHPGMRGIFLLIEAARQLRGESCSQVEGARLAVAHGNGGMLGSRHSGGTVILGGD